MARVFEEEKKVLITGNEVATWAAIAAGAEMMFGYPITPQNEIMHYWTRLAPKYNKSFLQTEDEISAGFTTCGAIMAGRKAFTATAGPGNVLMQEPMGMAEAMRLPFVAVIQQRGGPSSGTVIYSQQEVNLTTSGGNGEGHRIVYSTASHQDIYDYVIKAFNVAWKYRFPTFVLGDGYQAKMRESMVLYDPASRGIEHTPATPFLGQSGEIGKDRDAVHLRNIYSMEEELFDVLQGIEQDYQEMSKDLIEYDAQYCEDAELVIVSHGVVSRAGLDAVEILRSQGIAAGYFRPITLAPFPKEALRGVATKCKRILVVESALNQLQKLVKENLFGLSLELDVLAKPGVGIIADEIVDRYKELSESK